MPQPPHMFILSTGKFISAQIIKFPSVKRKTELPCVFSSQNLLNITTKEAELIQHACRPKENYIYICIHKPGKREMAEKEMEKEEEENMVERKEKNKESKRKGNIDGGLLR